MLLLLRRFFDGFLGRGFSGYVAQERQTLRGAVAQCDLHGVEEGVLEGDGVAVDDDHSFELGEAAGFGLEVDRFDVDVGVADGDEEQVAANDLGALLSEQGELARDGDILVDAVFDLFGAVHVLVGGEAEGEELAVVLAVRASGHPGDGVEPVARREGQDQQELGFLLIGQSEGDVVRLHRDFLLAQEFLRDRPEVLAVEQAASRLDVVGQILVGLHLEVVLRVTPVLLEVDGELVGGLEQVGEDVLPDLDDGVLVVDDVEVDGAVVGVDHRLDRVAHVVVTHAVRLRVGVAVGDRVGVLDPVEAAVLADDDVGVGVELEEGREFVDALLDQASEEDAAVAVNGAGDEDVGVAEGPGEGEAAEEVAQLDAAVAGVAGGGLVGFAAGFLAAERVIELFGLAVGDDVGVGDLAVVDARLDDLQVQRSRRSFLDHFGRNVGDPEDRFAGGGDFVDRGHHHAEAVGELQPSVDPTLLGRL